LNIKHAAVLRLQKRALIAHRDALDFNIFRLAFIAPLFSEYQLTPSLRRQIGQFPVKNSKLSTTTTNSVTLFAVLPEEFYKFTSIYAHLIAMYFFPYRK
jgi:hypothetical protein